MYQKEEEEGKPVNKGNMTMDPADSM